MFNLLKANLNNIRKKSNDIYFYLYQNDSLKEVYNAEYFNLSNTNDTVEISAKNTFFQCENCKNSDKNMCKYCDSYGAEKQFKIRLHNSNITNITCDIGCLEVNLNNNNRLKIEFN